MLRSVIILFVFASVANSQTPDVPAEVAMKADELKKVEIKDERPLLFRGPKELQIESCGKHLVLFSKRGGVFKVEAFANSGDPTKPPVVGAMIVTIEGPTPPPVPPLPADSLADELRSLYRSDPSASKAADVAALSALYEVAAESAKKADIVTAGKLLEVIRKASATLAADRLLPMRQRIGRELATVLPSDPAMNLTPELRDAAAKKFLEIAAILKKVQQ